VAAVTNEELREQRVRAAHNQAVFREVNERVEELAANWSPISFVCECLDTSCSATVPVTKAEYERIRSEPADFLVAPGHYSTEVEEVVAEHDLYTVVRKLGVAYDVAASSSPRHSASRH
jgi:hypothetical protein